MRLLSTGGDCSRAFPSADSTSTDTALIQLFHGFSILPSSRVYTGTESTAASSDGELKQTRNLQNHRYPEYMHSIVAEIDIIKINYNPGKQMRNAIIDLELTFRIFLAIGDAVMHVLSPSSGRIFSSHE